MQSASWFVSPEEKRQDEARETAVSQVPKEHRRLLSRRPLKVPSVDDEQIAAALEEMSAGEALGTAMPERPPRQGRVSTPPEASLPGSDSGRTATATCRTCSDVVVAGATAAAGTSSPGPTTRVTT